MKKLFLTLLFIGLCAVAAFSQTVEEQLQIANQRLVKTLDNLEKAEDVIKSREGEIEALKKLNKALEDASRTPCTLAFEKVKTDLTFWLSQMSADETKNKEVLKILKDVRKQGRRAVNQQCGTSSSSVWKMLWEGAKVAVPIAIAVSNE